MPSAQTIATAAVLMHSIVASKGHHRQVSVKGAFGRVSQPRCLITHGLRHTEVARHAVGSTRRYTFARTVR